MEKQKMIEALTELDMAFGRVRSAWERYNIDVEVDNSSYPFKRSFDELSCEVGNWVEDIVDQIEE